MNSATANKIYEFSLSSDIDNILVLSDSASNTRYSELLSRVGNCGVVKKRKHYKRITELLNKKRIKYSTLINEDESYEEEEQDDYIDVLLNSVENFNNVKNIDNAKIIVDNLLEICDVAILNNEIWQQEYFESFFHLIANYDASLFNKKHHITSLSLLHYVCKLNNIKILDIMLPHDSLNINIKDNTNSTPLILAVKERSDIEIIKMLVNAGAKLNICDEDGITALHYASKNCDLEVMKILEEKNKEFKIDTPLHYACKYSRELTPIKFLIEALKSKSYEDENAKNEAVKKFVNEQNYEGDTALMCVCKKILGESLNNKYSIIEYLIQNYADATIANLEGQTPLKIIHPDSLDIWKLISRKHYVELFVSIKKGEIDKIGKLVMAGLDLKFSSKEHIDEVYEDEYTRNIISSKRKEVDETYPLIVALENAPNSNTCMFLFDEKLGNLVADANPLDLHQSPLHIACLKVQLSYIVFLIKNNCNISACDDDGNTPLHILSTKGSFEGIRAFLTTAWEVCPYDIVSELLIMKNKSKDTVVMCAANNKHKECVDYLICAGSYTPIGFYRNKFNEAKASFNPPEGDVVAPPVDMVIYRMLTRSIISLLYHCCKYGMFYRVNEIIESNNNIQHKVNFKTEDKSYVMVKDKLTEVTTLETPLYVACYYGHTKVVELLLKYKADPNILARNGWSCLFIASKKGFIEIVKLLIDARANVNMKNKNDMTPLNIAAYGGHLEIVKLLVFMGADVNQGDKMGARPIHAAIQSGKLDIVAFLLLYGADINSATQTKITPLYVASYSGHDKIVELFLTPPTDPNKKPADLNFMNAEGLTPLVVASFNGRTHIVNMLLNAGANMFITGGKKVTALYAACQNGHIEVVKLLKTSGADVNTKIGNGNTCVHAAAIENRAEVLQLLIGWGALIDEQNVDGATPLYMACEKGHFETLNILITHGANPNTHNKHTVSPMNIAAQNGHTAIVEKLVSSGGNINSQTEDGPTPLFIASQNGKIDIVKILLTEGAQVDILTKEKETAIFVAGYFGHIEIVKLLIAAKANLDIIDRDGRTCLWWACKAGRTEIVKLYLEAGASIIISDRESVTPYGIAKQQGHAEICELLNNVTEQPNLCVVCLDNPRSVIFLPCRHLACCTDCNIKMDRAQNRKCPICRVPIFEAVQAYT